MIEARVSPVLNSEVWIRCRRRSPGRRRSPRRARGRGRAGRRRRCPEAVDGRTTPRITSQRVEPSAAAPSWSSRGTAMKRSRETEAMIGITMIVRIRLGVEDAGAGRLRRAEEGDEAERVVEEGLDCRARKGRGSGGPRSRGSRSGSRPASRPAARSRCGPRSAPAGRGRCRSRSPPGRREKSAIAEVISGAEEERPGAELFERRRPSCR